MYNKCKTLSLISDGSLQEVVEVETFIDSDVRSRLTKSKRNRKRKRKTPKHVPEPEPETVHAAALVLRRQKKQQTTPLLDFYQQVMPATKPTPPLIYCPLPLREIERIQEERVFAFPWDLHERIRFPAGAMVLFKVAGASGLKNQRFRALGKIECSRLERNHGICVKFAFDREDFRQAADYLPNWRAMPIATVSPVVAYNVFRILLERNLHLYPMFLS
jgi:hypothetical protein